MVQIPEGWQYQPHCLHEETRGENWCMNLECQYHDSSNKTLKKKRFNDIIIGELFRFLLFFFKKKIENMHKLALTSRRGRKGRKDGSK